MTDEEINEVSVSHLIQAVKETGRYSFLIGAGTSRPAPAGIPTAGELINDWRKECYDRDSPESGFDEWIEEMEVDVGDNEQYGFWFEERHPTRGQRRERIRDLVEDAEPTPYHIVLATLMSSSANNSSGDETNFVPHTLTPNFDDLLFDAFYRYLEDRPHLINHSAVASEFRVTRDRPTIVKLHGDYLYDNLQNTDDETSTLKEELRDILEQVVREYGLIVVGYGGYDESIMEPLLDADIEYGIYWCVRDPANLSPMAEQLLNQPNTFLVSIEGFESLMAQFGNQIDEIKLPDRGDLVSRAKLRADQLDGALEIREQAATDEEEEEFVEKSSLRSRVYNARDDRKYQKAAELADQLVELDPEDPKNYLIRGNAKYNLGQYQASIKDNTRAIELNPEYSGAYNNRGNAKKALGEIKEAITDYNDAIELDPEFALFYNNRGEARLAIGERKKAQRDIDQAIQLKGNSAIGRINRAFMKILDNEFESAINDADMAINHSDSPRLYAESYLMFLISAIALEIDFHEEEQKFRSYCEEDFKTKRHSEQIDSWVDTTQMKSEKKGKIRELVNLFRQHEIDTNIAS